MSGLLLGILTILSGIVLKPYEVPLIYNNTSITITTGGVDGLIRHNYKSKRFINLQLRLNQSDMMNHIVILHELGHYLCIKYKNDWSEMCANKYGVMMYEMYFYE